MSALVAEGFGLGEAAVDDAPYRHCRVERALSAERESDMLAWFETSAPWRLVEKDFYEQYEFSLLDAELPNHLVELFSPAALAPLRMAMSQAFDVQLGPRMTAVAHKLVAGQRIAIHNDFLEDGETHRLTVQLNRGLEDEDGGLFLLFNSADPADIHSILRPISGSGLAFEIGPSSFHAVSRQHGGERFTVVFSFHADR